MKKNKTKNAYHHGDLRRALLDASLSILQKEGYQELSLRKLAKLAGVSQAAPYRHYADLEALYADLAREGFLQLVESLGKVRSKFKKYPLLQFRESGVAYVRFAQDNPDLFRIMYGNQIMSHEKYPELKEAEDESFAILSSILKDCEAEGHIRKGILDKAAISAWTLVHGISVLLSGKQVMFRNMPPTKAKKITKELIQFLYSGLK